MTRYNAHALRIHLLYNDIVLLEQFFTDHDTNAIHVLPQMLHTWAKLIYSLAKLVYYHCNPNFMVFMHTDQHSFLVDGENGCIQFIYNDISTQNWHITHSNQMDRLLTYADEQETVYMLHQMENQQEIQQELSLTHEGYLLFGEYNNNYTVSVSILWYLTLY